MTTPKTSSLAVIGVLLLVMSGLFFRGVTVLKPALALDGDLARGPDGRRMFHADLMGRLFVNWDAYLCLVLGSSCLLWVGGRASLGTSEHLPQTAMTGRPDAPVNSPGRLRFDARFASWPSS